VSVQASLTAAGPVLRRYTLALVVAWSLALLGTATVLYACADRPVVGSFSRLGLNESFERFSRWSEINDARFEQTAEQARSGRSSAKVEAREVGPYGLYQLETIVRPTPGDRYTFTAWVKAGRAAAGNRVRVEILEQSTRSEVHYVVAAASRVLERRWRRISVTGAVGKNGDDHLDVFVSVARARRPGETIYVDDISLVRVASS
jgi:hypothetical protein